MSSYITCFRCIANLLKFAVNLGSFICICILVNSSRKNPFESHIIGNMTDYYIFENNTKINIQNKGKYNNFFNNRISTEENIINESEKILSYMGTKNKVYLRKLATKLFCDEMQDNFEKYMGIELSNIFDLNYDKIHSTSIICLLVTLSILFINIVSFYAIMCKAYFSENKNTKCLTYFFFLF